MVSKKRPSPAPTSATGTKAVPWTYQREGAEIFRNNRVGGIRLVAGSTDGHFVISDDYELAADNSLYPNFWQV